ncbi:GumC family protein [Brucella tritici]|uniref:GumC family protein n=1 Tax=Brucella tritici TaxID=94626 RepID=A0A6L3YQY7_9HYPH|nr:GumC family protein [Brucella tritici]KAB2665418.1 GumC family protein [Brucella tritici]KAB2685696.1 GumC family protein [Brucella tritici]
MSDHEERRKAGVEKPLLAFSDVRPTGSSSARPANRLDSETAPPWTPPATPDERAAFFRQHDHATQETPEPAKSVLEEELDDADVTELQKRVALIEAELERKVQERERRKIIAETPAPPPEPVRELVERERSVADRPVPDAEWKPLIDPRMAIDVLRGSRRLLLVSTLLGGVVAALYALSLPQMYVASTDILVDPRNIKTVGDELTPGQLPTDASLAVAESQARIIDSSSVLLKVIDKTDLTKDPEFNGTLVPTGIAGLFAQIREMLSPKKASDSQTLQTRVLYNLHKSIAIGRDAKTFIYSISVKTRDPQKSASLANTISSVFQSELASLQSDAARRTSDELSNRLADMRANVEQAERGAADFRASHDLVNVDGKLISDNDLTRLNDQLTNQRAETMRLQARVQVLSSATSDSVVSGVLPEDLRSNTLTALRAQYAQARQTASGLSTQLGPRHPALIQAQSQAGTVLNDIDAELRRIRSSLQVEVARSVQQEKDLTARLAQLKSQQANNSGDLVKLRELEREATARRSVYEAFLLRSRETNEQEGLNTANVRVLSEARPPLDPAGTSRKLFVIAGLIAGFLAGLAITAVRNFGRLLRLS